MDAYADLFDAIEVNAFYTRQVDFNRRAVAWAAAHGTAMVGNGDVHRLVQLGTTFSMIDAEPDVDAICLAVREGRTRVERRPIPVLTAAATFSSMAASNIVAGCIRVRGVLAQSASAVAAGRRLL